MARMPHRNASESCHSPRDPFSRGLGLLRTYVILLLSMTAVSILLPVYFSRFASAGFYDTMFLGEQIVGVICWAVLARGTWLCLRRLDHHDDQLLEIVILVLIAFGFCWEVVFVVNRVAGLGGGNVLGLTVPVWRAVGLVLHGLSLALIVAILVAARRINARFDGGLLRGSSILGLGTGCVIYWGTLLGLRVVNQIVSDVFIDHGSASPLYAELVEWQKGLSAAGYVLSVSICVWAYVLMGRARLRVPHTHLCATCGYDLGRGESGMCPKCGRETKASRTGDCGAAGIGQKKEY